MIIIIIIIIIIIMIIIIIIIIIVMAIIWITQKCGQIFSAKGIASDFLQNIIQADSSDNRK